MKNDEHLVWKWKTHQKQGIFGCNLNSVEVDFMQEVDMRWFLCGLLIRYLFLNIFKCYYMQLYFISHEDYKIKF